MLRQGIMDRSSLRPLVGVTACFKENGRGGWHHTVGDKYVLAAVHAVGALPILIPAIGPELGGDEQSTIEALDRLLDALGGVLHQLVHEVEGRRDHRSLKSSDIDVNYAPAHDIEIVDGGVLHRLLGERRVQVNSLHAQGVDRLAPRARLEALAEDGQVEAFSIPDAPAFALALQWHPEHQALENPVSMKLFDAFATACRSRAAARLSPPLRAA